MAYPYMQDEDERRRRRLWETPAGTAQGPPDLAAILSAASGGGRRSTPPSPPGPVQSYPDLTAQPGPARDVGGGQTFSPYTGPTLGGGYRSVIPGDDARPAARAPQYFNPQDAAAYAAHGITDPNAYGQAMGASTQRYMSSVPGMAEHFNNPYWAPMERGPSYSQRYAMPTLPAQNRVPQYQPPGGRGALPDYAGGNTQALDIDHPLIRLLSMLYPQMAQRGY